MQPDSSYQVIRPLGSTPVGNVWSAVDGEGRPVTVAVLEAHVAADQRWRDAFVAAAHALPPQTDGRPYASADFTAHTPWVTRLSDGSPGAEHLFLSLGIEYQPTAPAPPAPEPPTMPFPTSGMPQSMSGPPYPASGPPHPISVVPDNQPISDPRTQPYAADPFSSSIRRIEPSPPKPKRTGLWIALAVVVVLTLAGGGAYYFVAEGGDKPKPSPQPQAQTQTSAAAPAVTPTPLHPGLEPPRVGDWPAWRPFAAKDHAKKLTLDGVGFPVTVPPGWSCNPTANSEGFVKYSCGLTNGAAQIGGDLIVRDCAQPCDASQQKAMRGDEEAWAAQWRYVGKNATLAETLKVGGDDRYGLVIVAYVAGNTGGQLDKQLVLRMTGPSQWRNDLRKVADGVRSAAKF